MIIFLIVGQVIFAILLMQSRNTILDMSHRLEKLENDLLILKFRNRIENELKGRKDER